MNREVPAEALNSKKQEGGGLGSFYNPLCSFPIILWGCGRVERMVLLDIWVRNGIPSSLLPALLP